MHINHSFWITSKRCGSDKFHYRYTHGTCYIWDKTASNIKWLILSFISNKYWFFPNIIGRNAHIFCICYICSHCYVCIRTHNSYHFKAIQLFSILELMCVLEFQWMVLGMLVIWKRIHITLWSTSIIESCHIGVFHIREFCALLCCFWLAQVDMPIPVSVTSCNGAAIRLTQCSRGKLAR